MKKQNLLKTKIFKRIVVIILFSFLALFPACIALLDRLSGVTVEKIKERGVLLAVTSYGVNSYFIYKGEPFGFEYEMLQLLASELGVELEVRLADGRVPLIDILNSDYGDIVASNIALTKKRKRQYDFTAHFLTSRQVLIQRKSYAGQEIDVIRSTIDLIDKTVTVPSRSHYYDRLRNLSEEIGGDIQIDTVSKEVTEEDLIKMVSDGTIEYTIADETVAIINRFYYQNLDIETPVSFPQRIAWVVRRKSPELRTFINAWIKKIEEDGTLGALYDKYYKINRVLEEQLAFGQDPENVGRISEYDELIRKYSLLIGWDWRLIASLIYQESRFNPRARSWAGAGGLMQLMPSTAKMLSVRDRYNPEENVYAGIRHLKNLSDIWRVEVGGELNQLKFVLASYNAGVGHVVDAQRLAKKHGKDPKIWDENVELYILKLSNPEYYNDPVVQYGYCRGREPYNYVKEILSRYEIYKKHVPIVPPVYSEEE